jgi:hypothetical protein
VAVAVNGFGGKSSAWFNADDVTKFATALAAYPLPDGEIALSDGFGDDEGAVDEEQVGIRVGRVGLRGRSGSASICRQKYGETHARSLEMTSEPNC